MARTSVNKNGSLMRAAVRCGRPPKELAGAVEERILDAARKVFLDRGFEGASVDEIAETARSGKPTIYARFASKQELFVAALGRELAARNARVASYTPTGATVEERLASIGVTLLRETLTSEWIGLVRLAIAETRRFPDIGCSFGRTARERGTELVAWLLGGVAESGGLGTLPAFSPDHLATAARYFADLILLPMLMRALSGESLELLHAEIGPHVSQRVDFFLAACRNGGIS
jgi:AcrR family transcriptional regulator